MKYIISILLIIILFQSTVRYPNNLRVYDNHAEACVRAGEIELAILNYNKVLELNLQNNRTREKLKELQKSK
ncbi:hypothetical protein GTQ40_06870 [Flavobacteriaceae bacterium R38]|nr:hypothetical protein [Flavobacteriaceae bacterium R38]